MKKRKFLRSALLCSLLLGTHTLYAAKPKVDIIFAMDSSGSMDNEAEALENAITSTTQTLTSDFDLSTKLWSITDELDYYNVNFTSSVYDQITNSTINSYEDWGPAVYDLSSKYTGWRNGAVKIVVPLSDECPEDGDYCYQNDTDIANKARLAADAADVKVLPIISTGRNDITSRANLMATNNKILVFPTTSSVSTETMANAIKEIIATVTGAIVLPPVIASVDQTNGYLNIFLKKAPGATSIDFQVLEGSNVIQSANLTNVDKVSIPVTDGQSHNYTIKVRSVGTNADGKTIYSDYVETQASYKTVDDIIAMCGGSTVKRSRAVNGNPLTGPGSVCEMPKNMITNEMLQNTEVHIKTTSDPVDVTTGNFLYSNTDLTIPTAGVPFIVKRFYNSLDLYRGWDFSFINSMDISDLNHIVVNWGDNIKEEFISTESGWTSRFNPNKLYTESGFYVVEREDGTKYKFDLQGKISEVVNKKGLGYKYLYNGNNIEIKDTFDNHLATIERDANQRVTKVTDANGNALSYSYDTNGNISQYTNRAGQTEQYEYDANGILYKVIGADGNAFVENSYDAHGRVLTQLNGKGDMTEFVYNVDDVTYIVKDTTVTYPNGVTQKYDNLFNKLGATDIDSVKVSYGYDPNGKISQVKDPNDKTWKYERNKKGQITKATNPLGQSTLYRYDSAGNLTQVTSIDGKVTKFSYDANNNLTSITYADGTASSFEYDTNNLLTKATDQLGHTTTYSYNAKGFVEKVTLPNGGTVSYTYTPLGEVSTVTDPLGNVTKYEYDKEGRLTKVTDPLNHTVTYAYNGYGDLISITDPKNRTLQMEYNTDGLMTKVTLPDGNTIEATYDAVGRLIESKDKLGRVAKKEYDALGRVSKIIDPKGNEFSFEYDAIGNLIKITDAKGNDVQTEYDELYRPSSIIDANGVAVTTTTYNDLSLPVKVEDTVGKSLEFSYDTLNRLQSTTLSGLLTAKAVYNAIGQMTKIIDPKGYETLYDYDQLGNVTKETNPVGKETSYTYDLAGRITTSTDANGVVTSFTYDAAGNITRMTIGDKTITYTYDEVGNVLTVEDANGKISYTYDINDRVTSRTDIYGNVVNYAYDTVGRLSSLTYPDGKKVTYAYDNDDNLVKVTDFAGRVTTFEYDANANLTKATYPNGAYTLYEYDANDRLLSLKNFDKTGKLLTADEITRNETGDITQIQKTQLAQQDLSKVKNFNFEVNEFNQITKSDEGDFTYDDNGNLLSYIYDGKTINLTYDKTDSLIQAKIANDTFTYKYDAEGNRVEVSKNGTTTRYLIDNVLGLSKPLAKMDDTNNIQTYYIWTNGLGYAVNADGTTLQYLYDYKGNTNAVMNDTDTPVVAYAYTSYGKLMGQTGKLDNPFTFLGKYGIMSDSESLYYVRARYYSPELERWTQADAKRGNIASPLSINRYALNEGDEVNYVDVSGYKKCVQMMTKYDFTGYLMNEICEAGKDIWNSNSSTKNPATKAVIFVKSAGKGAVKSTYKMGKKAIYTVNHPIDSFNGIVDSGKAIKKSVEYTWENREKIYDKTMIGIQSAYNYAKENPDLVAKKTLKIIEEAPNVLLSEKSGEITGTFLNPFNIKGSQLLKRIPNYPLTGKTLSKAPLIINITYGGAKVTEYKNYYSQYIGRSNQK